MVQSVKYLFFILPLTLFADTSTINNLYFQRTEVKQINDSSYFIWGNLEFVFHGNSQILLETFSTATNWSISTETSDLCAIPLCPVCRNVEESHTLKPGDTLRLDVVFFLKKSVKNQNSQTRIGICLFPVITDTCNNLMHEWKNTIAVTKCLSLNDFIKE